jgi:hypothetical protein
MVAVPTNRSSRPSLCTLCMSNVQSSCCGRMHDLLSNTRMTWQEHVRFLMNLQVYMHVHVQCITAQSKSAHVCSPWAAQRHVVMKQLSHTIGTDALNVGISIGLSKKKYRKLILLADDASSAAPLKLLQQLSPHARRHTCQRLRAHVRTRAQIYQACLSLSATTTLEVATVERHILDHVPTVCIHYVDAKMFPCTHVHTGGANIFRS